MITVEAADRIISSNIPSFPPVKEKLENSFGRILQEDIYADRDLPAFDKSLMDGYAISFLEYKNGRRKFILESIQKAGSPPLSLRSKNGCIEITTGSILPKGCDCVVPFEDTVIQNGVMTIRDGARLQKMSHIRPQASDHKKGSLLVKKGTQIGPTHIAVAASVGKTHLIVSRELNLAVISTGDEIIDIHIKPKQWQIRKSNLYFLRSALEQTGFCRTQAFHLVDNKAVMFSEIKGILTKFDIIVLTGGVSMGRFDYVPEVLKELNVKVLFHKVSQKPGKPFWFGKNSAGKIVFALPGNPVSTQVGAVRYIIPHLAKALGKTKKHEYMLLGKNFRPDTRFTFFLPVKMAYNEAIPVKTGGSGDFSSLADTDGFLEVPEGGKIIKKGSVLPFYRWS